MKKWSQTILHPTHPDTSSCRSVHTWMGVWTRSEWKRIYDSDGVCGAWVRAGQTGKNVTLFCCQESQWAMNQQPGPVKQACNLLGGGASSLLSFCGMKQRKLGGLWRADRRWRVTRRERVHDMKITNSCEEEQGGFVHSVCHLLKGSEVKSHWQVWQQLSKSYPDCWEAWTTQGPGPHHCRFQIDGSRHKKKVNPLASKQVFFTGFHLRGEKSSQMVDVIGKVLFLNPLLQKTMNQWSRKGDVIFKYKYKKLSTIYPISLVNGELGQFTK